MCCLPSNTPWGPAKESYQYELRVQENAITHSQQSILRQTSIVCEIDKVVPPPPLSIRPECGSNLRQTHTKEEINLLYNLLRDPFPLDVLTQPKEGGDE